MGDTYTDTIRYMINGILGDNISNIIEITIEIKIQIISSFPENSEFWENFEDSEFSDNSKYYDYYESYESC